jgi:hypothetical protein
MAEQRWKDGYIKVTVSARGEVLSASHEAELVFGRVNMTLGCIDEPRLVARDAQAHCGDDPGFHACAPQPLSHVSLHVSLTIRCQSIVLRVR